MTTINETAAQIMEHLCTHDWHGYTQGNRWGDGGTETLTIDGKKYTIATGDRDCSSAVISAYKTALIGTKYEGVLDAATYTGNMRQVFVNSGLFEWKPMSFIAQRGDIYLNEYSHTAMCTSPNPDMLAEFSISENGTIYGQVGDQTGNESHIRTYYDFPWDGILHWVGGDIRSSGSSSSNSTASADIPKLRYRVSVDSKGASWYDEMVDLKCSDGCGDDFAGDGVNSIRWLAIKMNGYYQVKTEKAGKWLGKIRGYDIKNLDTGCAGDGSPILAVRCYYETQEPNKTGWLAIEYQVSTKSKKYAKMHDLTDTGGSSDDFAGNGKDPITKFSARLVKA